MQHGFRKRYRGMIPGLPMRECGFQNTDLHAKYESGALYQKIEQYDIG